MINPIAILFSIIHLPEPAIEDDDTALFTPVVDEPPVLRTHPITPLLSAGQMLGSMVAYRMTSADEWQVGNVRAIDDTRFGVKVLFTPKDSRLPEKWRFLNECVFCWYE